MTTAAERHRLAELSRLRRLIANPDASAFERETAQRALDKLTAPPICKWCRGPAHGAEAAVCRVLDRFRRKHGRELFPTESQAEEIRRAIAADDAAKAATERRKDLKNRQGSLF